MMTQTNQNQKTASGIVQALGNLPYRTRLLNTHKLPAGNMTAPGAIVLIELLDNDQTPFVTWWFNAQSGGFSSGHYFITQDEANKDFEARS